MSGQREFQELFKRRQASAQILPVAAARGAEVRETLQLNPTNRRLQIERFQIISEVAVDVFVIVSLRQFTELPAEALPTGVVDSARAPAIAPPVTETFHDYFEAHIARDVHRASLAHRDVVGRIKRLSR